MFHKQAFEGLRDVLKNLVFSRTRPCESAFLGPSIKYVRKIFRKTNISNPLIRTQNVSFSENFAYALRMINLLTAGQHLLLY